MKKKLLTLFAILTLAVCGMLLCISASAVTYTGSCGENVTYSLDTATGVLEISGTGDMYNSSHYSNGYFPWEDSKESITKVVIKDGVTSIGESAFACCRGLASVTIGNSVTSIGDWAFFCCSGLTSVMIPDSVTSIGEWSFSSCSGLTNVTIGDSVTRIWNSAFYDCSNLTAIEVDENNASFCDIDGVLFSKDKTVIVTYPAGIKIQRIRYLIA